MSAPAGQLFRFCTVEFPKPILMYNLQRTPRCTFTKNTLVNVTVWEYQWICYAFLIMCKCINCKNTLVNSSYFFSVCYFLVNRNICIYYVCTMTTHYVFQSLQKELEPYRDISRISDIDRMYLHNKQTKYRKYATMRAILRSSPDERVRMFEAM